MTPSTVGRVRTLSVDIGGTGIKMLVVDSTTHATTQRTREKTPDPATPEAVLDTVAQMAGSHEPFERVSIGFPGVVRQGMAVTAPNLNTELWARYPVQTAVAERLGRPTRVVNDADLQGYGVIEGQGVELVLTLGTGLGSALFSEGQLVPNLELGHHPFEKGKTYEERISDAERKRVGVKRWERRVLRMLATLSPIFNYDVVHLGGGNARRLVGPLPNNVRCFDSAEALRGGLCLWQRSTG